VEVERLGEDGGYMARGEHDPQEFVEAIKKQWDDDRFPAANVRIGHVRVIPYAGDPYEMCIHWSKPGPGAFLVTMVEFTRRAAAALREGKS
jgi:hypothetical protein